MSLALKDVPIHQNIHAFIGDEEGQEAIRALRSPGQSIN
jgi:hypothetical protein